MLNNEQKQKLRRFMELRQDRDETKQAAETAEEAYREAEAELWDSMEDSAIKGGIKVDLGEPWGTVRFSPRETYFGRVTNAEQALEYFENAARVEEFTSPKIVMARVNELVRTAIEEGALDTIPPGLDWYAKRYVAITRQKG